MLTLILAVLLGAERTPEPPPLPAVVDGWTEPITVTGTVNGITTQHPLIVYLPRGYAAAKRLRPLVLALHGWRHSAAMLRDKGELARWADQHDVVLALPDMGTTVYETILYPETRAAQAWSQVPGTRWVGEVILPYVRAHFAVHPERARTAIIGYSTGGRGALLVAAVYPEFAFAGSLSGTFDLMRLKPTEGEYRIHEMVFGSRERFPGRWELDNVVAPARLEKLAGVRLYVAHGAQDRAVRPAQLAALRAALEGLDVTASWHVEPTAGHDWAFWNAQWGPMFAALDEAVTRAR